MFKMTVEQIKNKITTLDRNRSGFGCHKDENRSPGK